MTNNIIVISYTQAGISYIPYENSRLFLCPSTESY